MLQLITVGRSAYLTIVLVSSSEFVKLASTPLLSTDVAGSYIVSCNGARLSGLCIFQPPANPACKGG